jgi:acetoin utilization protein AcuB
MRTKRIHHLVVTKGSRIVGILSDRDAGGRQGTAVRQNRTVADLMTTPTVTVPPETTVRKAANLMRGRSIGCLVVADDARRIVGIVTVSDLLELLGRGLDRHAAAGKRWTLKHRVPHRHTSRAAGVW